MVPEVVQPRADGARVLAWALALTGCGQTPADPTGEGSSTTSSSTTSSSTSTSTSSSTSSASTTDPTPTTGTADTLPPAPTLQSPADGATDLPLQTSLCWDLVDDPDGEPLRYRVFIDDTELAEGILDPDELGHAGPCVGPLFFAHERTYTWRVIAFEVDDPTRSSPPSPTWSFSTVRDGVAQTIFSDDFNEDLGWQVRGDAGSGAWVRGDPGLAYAGDELSQPGRCLGGDICFFTGQNPDGQPDQQDVAGGSTILLSPEFDLAGAPAATIQLGRFFFKKSAALDPGPRLVVDLLTPRDGAPGEYDAHPLEQLTAATSDTADNLWLPREYTVCDPTHLKSGSRLRITATDAGDGILEAAIDSVKVRAYDDATVCGGGDGGACDPGAGEDACPGELLCCSQGVINQGIYRCGPAVAGLDFAAPPPTRDAPGNGPPGCDAPDLIVDAQWLSPIFADIQVRADTCELAEGCVGGQGGRRLMLFTVATPNIGSTDLVMGVPANHPDLYHYSDCHSHYHFDEFARYQLRKGDEVVATGHKQAFCMLDTISWAWPFELPTFDCANQGISRGFTDFYESGLPCQWIDVTGVPAGDYTLEIVLNQPREASALPVLNERDYTNNTLELAVTVP